MPTPNFPIEGSNLNSASDVLRAVAHPLRMQIIDCISERGIATVQEIHTALDIEQSLTSQHLRILRRVNVVSAKRDGKFVNYSVSSERLNQVAKAVNNFLDTPELV